MFKGIEPTAAVEGSGYSGVPWVGYLCVKIPMPPSPCMTSAIYPNVSWGKNSGLEAKGAWCI